jgi:ABC-type phosphate transport system substrate-binding protein
MKRAAIVVLAFTLISIVGICFAADFVVVVNKGNPINVISKYDLKQVALGKKSEWKDGSKIFFVMREGQGVHENFVKEILNKNTAQYANYWKMAIFTGTGTPPKTVKSDEEVKNIVAGRRDAIGYISPSAVDSTVKKIGVE